MTYVRAALGTTALIAALTMVTACAAGPGRPAPPPPSASLSASPPPTPLSPSSNSPVVIGHSDLVLTDADNGRTITVPAGSTIEVKLTVPHNLALGVITGWSPGTIVPPPPGGIGSGATVPVLTDLGNGFFHAYAAGTADLAAFFDGPGAAAKVWAATIIVIGCPAGLSCPTPTIAAPGSTCASPPSTPSGPVEQDRLDLTNTDNCRSFAVAVDATIFVRLSTPYNSGRSVYVSTWTTASANTAPSSPVMTNLGSGYFHASAPGTAILAAGPGSPPAWRVNITVLPRR